MKGEEGSRIKKKGGKSDDHNNRRRKEFLGEKGTRYSSKIWERDIAKRGC